MQTACWKEDVRYAPCTPRGHNMAGTPVDHLQELLSKLDEHIKQQQTKKALRTADSSESSLPPQLCFDMSAMRCPYAHVTLVCSCSSQEDAGGC